MIPYLRVPDLWLARVAVDAETILTASGLVFAIVLAHRRARSAAVDGKQLNSFVRWLLVGALIGGHLSDLLCYRPTVIASFQDGSLRWSKPWELLYLWDGWRSIGGFLGALVAAVIWRTHRFQLTRLLRFSEHTSIDGYWFVRRERAEPILALADVVLSVFPIAWVFNRAGCALIHNHPGRMATTPSVLAVAFPAPKSDLSAFGMIYGGVPRYDLGLLELLVTFCMVVAVVAMWRKGSFRAGSYVCFAGLTYPPARFALDFLRRRTGPAVDTTYATLTPSQWGCVILCLLSVAMLLRIHRRPVERRLPSVP